MSINRSPIELLVFEIIERIIRFHDHLTEVNNQFFAGRDRIGNDKVKLIRDYQDYLFELFQISVSLLLVDSSGEEISKEMEIQARNVFKCLSILHKDYLHFLPRTSEPVELRRFTRIIDRKHLRGFARIEIFPTEDIGETTFSSALLKKFEDDAMSKTRANFRQFSNNFGLREADGLLQQSSLEDNRFDTHITIPRIDTTNPCRWPTIVHEMAHHLMPEDLNNRFDMFLADCGTSFVESVLANARCRNRVKWITELWADLFSALILGPAVWFSQWVSFLFSDSDYPVTSLEHFDDYPPAILRLNLIHRVLRHRYQELMCSNTVASLVEEQKNVFSLLANCRGVADIESLPSLVSVEQMFGTFFLERVFKKDAAIDISESLHEDVEKLIREVKKIGLRELETMVDALERGMPVPNVIREETANLRIEEPALLPEILLAAWIYRNQRLLSSVIDRFSGAQRATVDSPQQFSELLRQEFVELLATFKRFDQSVLRSIQVSEWFELLRSRSESSVTVSAVKKSDDFKDGRVPQGVLVDSEIMAAIHSKRLFIVPIMNIEEQLGASSLDLRLGTTFEIFHRNRYGIIDFVDPTGSDRLPGHSEIVDLDFLESTVLTPGQFVLAHTMEYIILQDDLAAEIEGRSSFARLGLQVHMTAGFIDPGFSGSITLEIFNSGNMPIVLYPGLRIAQVRFIPVNRPNNSYSVRHASKYRNMLSQHQSKQHSDYEINRIREALHKQGQKS